jgi:hypothetical protein
MSVQKIEASAPEEGSKSESFEMILTNTLPGFSEKSVSADVRKRRNLGIQIGQRAI